MPRYIIERNMDVSGLTDEDLRAAGLKSIEVISELPGLRWIRSYVSEKEGKIYCEYESPNPELIREHARRLGVPADRISEIKMEVSPEMFR